MRGLWDRRSTGPRLTQDVYAIGRLLARYKPANVPDSGFRATARNLIEIGRCRGSVEDRSPHRANRISGVEPSERAFTLGRSSGPCSDRFLSACAVSGWAI
jgi:hypothetical protein